MKKKIIFAASFILVAWTMTSCEDLLKDCKSCKIVERTSGGAIVQEGGAVERCGAERAAFILANPPVVDPVTGNVTKVECN